MNQNNTAHLTSKDIVINEMVRFTKEEILTIQRALNALRVRNELKCVSASEDYKRELTETIENINYLEHKITLLQPNTDVIVESPEPLCKLSRQGDLS